MECGKEAKYTRPGQSPVISLAYSTSMVGRNAPWNTGTVDRDRVAAHAYKMTYLNTFLYSKCIRKPFFNIKKH